MRSMLWESSPRSTGGVVFEEEGAAHVALFVIGCFLMLRELGSLEELASVQFLTSYLL